MALLDQQPAADGLEALGTRNVMSKVALSRGWSLLRIPPRGDLRLPEGERRLGVAADPGEDTSPEMFS